ncbi:MAG: Uma2 family endonuclease [Betaproteobacteria bacterium]|nr:Uma2 family endonuclease [Betaproteobacteria bacterium]MBI2961348.1 Uma2 family endonuclease [Betaproteobacteria bacterium]
MGALETAHRRKLSLEEFHRMGEAGILGEDDRIELIDGEMIEMAPIGAQHLAMVNRLSRMLNLAAGKDAIVSTQNPVALPPQNEPQPDVALLRPRADDYRARLPTAADVLLIIEIADTTLVYDRDVKIPLYARHGVAEVWLFDIQSGSLFVHREPAPKGYQRILAPEKNETISPMLLPAIQIELAELWR